MLYTDFRVGDKTLKLRITARASVALEKKLGKNPICIFLDDKSGKIPSQSEVLAVLHASLQALEHGYTEEAVYKLFDEYVDEGHNLYDLVQVIVEVFQDSGIMPRSGETPEQQDPNE